MGGQGLLAWALQAGFEAQGREVVVARALQCLVQQGRLGKAGGQRAVLQATPR